MDWFCDWGKIGFMQWFLGVAVIFLCSAVAPVLAQQPDPLGNLIEKKQVALNRLDVTTADELEDLAQKAMDRKDATLALAATKTAAGLNPSHELDSDEKAAVIAAMPKRESLPREAQMILEKRDSRQKEIHQVYLQELAKLKAKFIADKNIKGLALVEEEIVKATPVQEKLGSDLLARDQGKNKIVISARVFQVVNEGLLFYDVGRFCLLKNHPDQGNAVGGMHINCYAIRTDEMVSCGGAAVPKRMAQVYLYHARRIGK